MTAYNRLVTAIREDLDPKFHIKAKNLSLIGRIHDKFSPNAAVILGHTCYVPEQFFVSPSSMAQIVAHEGTHVAQKKDLGALQFNYRYSYPLSLAAIILLAASIMLTIGIYVGGFALIVVGSIFALTGVVYALNNRLARDRAILELEAFATSWWYFYGTDEVEDTFLVLTWITGIRQMLNSSTYLNCGVSIGNPMISSILINAVKGTPFLCDGVKRDHTVRWLLTAREILLDESARQV